MSILSRTIAVSLLAAALPAFAGGTATVESAGGKSSARMQISWTGDKMRMDFPQQAGTYMIVRDGKTYSVTDQGGQTMVMDISSMSQMADSQAAAEMGVQKAESVNSIEATGETETVAGIEGEIYTITWTDNQGEQQQNTAVLSDNELTVGLTEAFQSFADAGGGQPDPIGAAMAERGLGILRFGDSFTVISISGETPAAGEFELPAEPMDMQKMMQRFGGGGH